MREISPEDYEMIARGGMSVVYRLSDEQVIKLYNSGTTLETLERSKRISDELNAAGIPAEAFHEVVKAGNSWGIISERLGPDTVAMAVRRDPDSEETYGLKMSELLKKMHRTEMTGGSLPAIKDLLAEWIAVMEHDYQMGRMTARCMRQLVRSLPDTGRVLHLDFHEGNVMLRGDELVMVDIDEMCTGEPAFDIAGLYINHIFAAGTPGLLEESVGLDAGTVRRMFRNIMRSYFGEDERSYRNAVRLGHMLCMLLVSLAPARFGEISQLNKLNMWFIKHVAQPAFCMMWLRNRKKADELFASARPRTQV